MNTPRIFFALLVLAAFIITLVQCEQSPTGNQDLNGSQNVALQKSFTNPYEAVGDGHNICLDTVYTFLLRNKARLTTSDSIRKYVKQGTDYFLSGTAPSEGCTYDYRITDAFNIARQTRAYRAGLTSVSALDSVIEAGLLTDFESRYAQKMAALSAKVVSNTALEDSIHYILNQAVKEGGLQQSRALLVYGTVLVKSGYYWAGNADKWAALFGSNLEKATADDSYKEADAVTAMVASFGCIGSLFGWAGCVVATSGLASAAVFALQ